MRGRRKGLTSGGWTGSKVSILLAGVLVYVPVCGALTVLLVHIPVCVGHYVHFASSVL